jgi:hypothetical protein
MGEKIYSMKLSCPFCKEDLEYKNVLIENMLSFGFIAVCRNCGGGFFITSRLQEFAYKHFNLVRGIKDYVNKVKNSLAKKVA